MQTDQSFPDGKDFVPLHCHSHFSILDGLSSPEEIAARAKELGHIAVALTDHGSCGGLYHFQKACRKEGIKPILGVEAYLVQDTNLREKDEKRRHITLWVKNPKGYKNIMALATKSNLEGFYGKPRISLADLEKFKDGLMAGSACANGAICSYFLDGDVQGAEKMATDLKLIFGDDFYCEIMVHKYESKMKEKQKEFIKAMKSVLDLADRLGIKSIMTYDSHYCRKEDAFYQDVLLSIQTKDTIKNPNRFSFWSSDFYMKPISEVLSLCPTRRDLIQNTLEVASKVVDEDIIKTSAPLLPDFQLPLGEKSEEAYLKTLIRQGMISRGILEKQEYRERILSELDVIIKCGFTRYFLILWDIVNYARRTGIRVGPGRGSGAASLCLYCLNVTQLDPIKHSLLFARFLNPDRVSPPDVDLDFDDSRQEEMFGYVSRKYGQEYVARIGTYTSLKAKDAVRRVVKALDVGDDWEDSDKQGKWKSGENTMRVVNMMSEALPNVPGLTVKDAVKDIREVQELSERYPKVFEVAEKIQGTLVAAGVHPAGIIVCKEKIADMVPLRMTSGVSCTQYDMKEVDPLGLLKFDFLGLRTLRVIDKCLSLIHSRTGEEIKIDELVPDDKATFAILNAGNVEGVFQFESGDGKYGISRLLRDIRVDSFDDMVVTCALYRPGTLKAGVPDDYCNYKHKRKSVKYVHPMMKDLLGDTFGMMVYQEQVMLVAMKMAGFSNVEADYLRKAMGKKDDELMKKLLDKFVNGCVKNKIDQVVAERIFELCRYFSGYGFNKAHSAAYAYLAYQTAWLKANYPMEFMCSLMSANSSDDVRRIKYEKACGEMGITLLPHHINKSKEDYVIEGSGIRRPFLSLKGVGENAVKSIVSGQPYSSLEDLISRVSGQVVNSRVFETLVHSNCMENFGMTSRQLIDSFGTIKQKVKKIAKQKEKFKGFDEENDLFACDI